MERRAEIDIKPHAYARFSCFCSSNGLELQLEALKRFARGGFKRRPLARVKISIKNRMSLADMNQSDHNS